MSSDHPTKPPVLQKPPTYKNPNAAAAQPPLKPPPKALSILPSTYPNKKKRQQSRRSRRSCCRTSCCCTFIVTLILSATLLLSGGLFYLWYEPKAPVFHLQSFRFTQFNVSAVDGDETYLIVGTESRVELKNPNQKLGLYYGSSEVSIRIPASVGGGGGDIDLGSKTLPGFSQEKRNVTSIKVVTPLTRVALTGDGEGKKIMSDVRRKVVRVTVEVRTKVGIRVGGKVRMGSVVVNVECKNVQLKKIQIDGFMPRCSIRLWDWPINT